MAKFSIVSASTGSGIYCTYANNQPIKTAIRSLKSQYCFTWGGCKSKQESETGVKIPESEQLDFQQNSKESQQLDMCLSLLLI